MNWLELTQIHLARRVGCDGIANIGNGFRITSVELLYTESGGRILITEAEVERSFRKLVKSGQFNQEIFEKGEALLEQLRPESPLRHRLSIELDELRDLRPSN